MGRRALRRIDPSIDLSWHLRGIDQIPVPLDSCDFFGRQAPLEIEIGSGKGLFLATASDEHPERDFLGCEVSRKYARFAAAKLARLDRGNAVVVHGDAKTLLHDAVPDLAVAAVHVYFPDPWWKKRHKPRRIMTAAVLTDVERILVPGGRLHFWTDVQEYFQSTLELIAQATSLKGPLSVPEQAASHDMDYRTHYERRTRKSSLPVYRAEFQRCRVLSRPT